MGSLRRSLQLSGGCLDSPHPSAGGSSNEQFSVAKYMETQRIASVFEVSEVSFSIYFFTRKFSLFLTVIMSGF
jgi:hypothetical protein